MPSQPQSPPLRTPHLPAAYELTVVDEVDSVLAEGVRLARDGAPEGTLIWARRQSNARTRRGHPWDAPEGNLHCSLLMQPEYPSHQASQLCLVAALAAGAAIAEVLTPMTGLSYGWPGDILINELLAGQVQLAAGPPGSNPWDWLVIAVSVNVAHHPVNPEPERFNSIHASAGGEADDTDAGQLLTYFARHFLRQVNLWAEAGYQDVARSWSQRAHQMVAPQRLQDLCPREAGARADLGPHGTLQLHPGDRNPFILSITEYFDLGARDPKAP